MWMIWILPIFIFMLYGQRIQLQVTSSEINKGLEKIKSYRDDTRKELIAYVKNTIKPSADPTALLDRYFEYFTIMPVDMDPNGIVPKIKHIMRTREDSTREQVKSLSPDITHVQASQVINILAAVTTLHMLYKMVRHFFLTAKKQNNFPLILPLQMMMPFILEEAEALKVAVSAFKQGQPIGDGIGPMVVEKMISENKPDIIIMVDAALKLEGEDTGSIAQGFGAAIGGVGTERFEIEGIATKNNIPIYAIVIKQSIKEAITLMKKEIADSSDSVSSQVYDIIKSTTKIGQRVLIIGVGNTLGVSQ